MTKNNRKVNWYYIAIGLIIFLWSFSQFNSTSKLDIELENISVTLKFNIENVKGRRNKADYRFESKEYKSRFIILDGSINSKNRGKIGLLRKGKIINIKINKHDLNKLNSTKYDITVYGIKSNNEYLLAFEDFKVNRNKYSNRVNFLFLFVGFMVILKGINSISDRILYYIFLAFILLVFILRYLKIGY